MGNVKIGWAMREISLEEPVVMPGQMYMRVSEGIHDPLYATALVIDGGEGQDTAAFCSVDMTSLYSGVAPLVAAEVHRRCPEIAEDAVILNVTHTHSAIDTRDTAETTPDGQPVYTGARYRAFFVQQCADAICEAWEGRRTGAIGYGYGYAVTGHSRRTTYLEDLSVRGESLYAPNGYGMMYGKTADEQFSHYESGADHFLNLLFTFDENHALTGVVVNVPCPSQTSEHFMKLSADYWCEVRALVKERFGAQVQVLPQCAAAGDLSPRILHYLDAQKRRYELKYGAEFEATDAKDYQKIMADRHEIAERIVEGIQEVYSWAKNDIRGDVCVRHEKRSVGLRRRTITEEEKVFCEERLQRLEKKLEAAWDDTPMRVRTEVSSLRTFMIRDRRVLQWYEEQAQGIRRQSAIHAVRIGDIAFATNEFELYMDYMHRMQARSPFIQTFVVQLCGDVTGGDERGAGYLATARAAENKGYSANLYCNEVSPEGGQQLVEETLNMLNELWAQN